MAYKEGSSNVGTVTQYDVLVGGASSAIASVGPGSSGQVLQSGGNAANPAYSTATYPATATGTGTILRADGTNWSATTTTYPTTTTINQILYSSSANVVGGITTANNSVLTTNGSGVPSLTTTITGKQGGGFVLVSAQTASSSATIAFTGLNVYPVYFLTWDNVQNVTNTQKLTIQVSNNGGSSYINTGYSAGVNYSAYSSNTITNTNSTTFVPLTNTQANNGLAQGYCFIYNINVGSQCIFVGQSSWNDSGASAYVTGSLLGQAGATGVNAIQIAYASGNIFEGTFSLYGLQQS